MQRSSASAFDASSSRPAWADGSGRTVRAHGAGTRAVFYQDPASRRTWDGTGPRPAWIAVAEDAGRSRDEFLVGGRLPGVSVRAWMDGPALLQFHALPTSSSR